jgi:hypothetical protein
MANGRGVSTQFAEYMLSFGHNGNTVRSGPRRQRGRREKGQKGTPTPDVDSPFVRFIVRKAFIIK